MVPPPAQPEPSLPDDDAQADRLMPVVYDELRRIAAGLLHDREGFTIQPTVLVHEAYMKLAREHSSHWHDEAHFRAVASIAMRRVLADHVRTRERLKRGSGQVQRLDLGPVDGLPSPREAPQLAHVHEALEELEQSAPRVARLVVYRFFGDLDVHQAAERLGVSLSTAEADWRFARAWLKRRLSTAGHEPA